MCYHAKFGRSALKGVGKNTGEPQNRGALRSLRMGGVADPKIHAPPRDPDMCYHVKFGGSSTRVGLYT